MMMLCCLYRIFSLSVICVWLVCIELLDFSIVSHQTENEEINMFIHIRVFAWARFEKSMGPINSEHPIHHIINVLYIIVYLLVMLAIYKTCATVANIR